MYVYVYTYISVYTYIHIKYFCCNLNNYELGFIHTFKNKGLSITNDSWNGPSRCYFQLINRKVLSLSIADTAFKGGWSKWLGFSFYLLLNSVIFIISDVWVSEQRCQDIKIGLLLFVLPPQNQHRYAG